MRAAFMVKLALQRCNSEFERDYQINHRDDQRMLATNHSRKKLAKNSSPRNSRKRRIADNTGEDDSKEKREE